MLNSKSLDFSVIVDKPFNDALFDITQDYDRDISAVGFSQTFNSSNSNKNNTYSDAFEYLASLSSSNGTQIHLLKVNHYADVTISKKTSLEKFNKAAAVVKTPSNGYFVGGYTLNGSLIVLKLDANANTIFVKEFGTNNYDRMNNLILLSDGGILAVGSSVTSRSRADNIFETGLGQNDIYLTRFSKNGDQLWSKKYGTQHDDRGIDAVEARDGSIIVVATTSYDKNKNVTLMRITENGNKIWLKHYKSENITTPKKLIRLIDDNFLLSISQRDDMQKEQIRLIKFDLQKNILIDKTINTTYSSALNDIKEFSDNRLIGVGYVKDLFNTDALAMILDSELNLLVQEHYGDANYDSFNALHILHNSQIAVAGVNTYENSQETNMWIVKLNKDLSISQKSTKSKSINEKLSTLFEDEIYQKKMALKEDLSMEFIDISLYFEQDQYILTQQQKKFLTIFSKKLIPFLKKNRDIIEVLEINGHASSEWSRTNFTTRYLKNEKLSMQRSYSVLSYIFKNQDKDVQYLLSKIIKGSGYSSSKKVMQNDKENREKSRRVSFKIILKK